MRLMISSGKLKTFGRVASLVLLLMAAMGPWFIDSHPATEEACSPPLVWQGNGYCACFVSLKEAFRMAFLPGHHLLWLVCLPPALPFLSTLLLIFSRERRWLWVCHLIAWGLVAIYSLFLFVGYWYRHPALIQWGAGISGVVAVAVLVGEMLVDKSQILNKSP
jgi:hypothetical protein